MIESLSKGFNHHWKYAHLKPTQKTTTHIILNQHGRFTDHSAPFPGPPFAANPLFGLRASSRALSGAWSRRRDPPDCLGVLPLASQNSSAESWWLVASLVFALSFFYRDQSHPLSGGLKGTNPRNNQNHEPGSGGGGVKENTSEKPAMCKEPYALTHDVRFNWRVAGPRSKVLEQGEPVLP